MDDTSDSAGTEAPGKGIEDKVVFLGRTDAYPEGTKAVEIVETHMSWVFLTDKFVYKLKKPVRYEFLDYRTLDARHRNCEEEVRLNRRLAPAVYLGVVALRAASEGGLALAGSGVVMDWLVKMRRLDRRRMLDRAIASGRVHEAQVRAVARLLATFYRRAEPVRMSGAAYRARFAAEIAANRGHLVDPAYGLPRAPIDRACAAQRRFLTAHEGLFDRRADDRRIVEAHGDLRPEHIWLGEPPQIIDCLEFNRDFRLLDPVDELSFLALECERLGAPAIGPVVLAVYRQVTGDAPAEALIAFYKSYRACLRAKIAAWHLREPEVRDPGRWTDLARTYLRLAERYAGQLSDGFHS